MDNCVNAAHSSTHMHIDAKARSAEARVCNLRANCAPLAFTTG